MALTFQPKEGDVLMCDFRGYEEPEMVKKRHAVVIRRHRTNSKLVTVVPLSTTAPEEMMDYHVQLESMLKQGGEVCWAKSDLVATVGLNRLDRCKMRDRNGNRQYVTFKLNAQDLQQVKDAVKTALGL
ncbi:type II toxin-antitoxin system PemK/MazF family toxin [Pseudomonas putida]|nr:type II toxin-antitoxin system PemK/MazF family toxin [Pseudomonas putida]EKT8864773.1 type II toxin-antitoxin system PemK/MazF family toxin [Pseudomonas putida]